jgi:hypothetical protein
MPKIGMRESFEMETRNKYTKVECELAISVNGRELPSAAVLGSALEEAIKIVEARVKESYEVVPPRDVPQPQANATPSTPAVPNVPGLPKPPVPAS